MQITTCPPPICNEYAEARHGEAACGGAAVPREAFGPRAGECTAQGVFQRVVAEMGHEPRAAAVGGRGDTVKGVVAESSVRRQRATLQARSNGGECGAPLGGVGGNDGDARGVVPVRAEPLDTPEIANGEIRAAGAAFGHATRTAGARAEEAEEGGGVRRRVEGRPALAPVGQRPGEAPTAPRAAIGLAAKAHRPRRLA